MKILAFTPTYADALAPETVASMDAQRFDGVLDWVVSKDNPYPVPDHRNVLAQYRVARERCISEGYDALLTVEHDMVLPTNAVQELANTAGDVAFGVYLFRWGSFVLNAFEYIGERNIGESLSLHPKKARAAVKAGTVRVSGAGWGCTLLRRSALEAIEFPEEYPENPAYDIRFAQLAIRAGLEMHANFRVLCGHKQRRIEIRNTERTDVARDEILWPFVHDFRVQDSGYFMQVAGEHLPLYRDAAKADASVIARQSVNVTANGKGMKLIAGQGYLLPYDLAFDLARAAYVEILL